MITSQNNPRYKQVKKLLTSSHFRRKTGLTVVYGDKPVNLLLENAPDTIEFILHSERAQIPYTPKAIQIEHKLLEALPEGTIADQGVVAVIRPKLVKPEDIAKTSHTLLVLDGIQDPENIGTIVRTAIAFGITSIITTLDSAHPFHPKAVRASAGYILLAKISRAEQNTILAMLNDRGFTLLISTPAATGKNTPCRVNKPFAIILGNEGHGASGVWKLANRYRLVSIKTQIESLNVAAAAAILIYTLTGGELQCLEN